MRKFYIIILIFLFSCNSENISNSEKISVKYNPIDIVKPDDYSLEVYDYMGLKDILNTNNDTVYVLNFWATWCKPCIEELPYFEEVNSEYENSKFKMILVSLDFKKNIESKLIPYIMKNNLKSKVIMLNDSNSDFWINDIDKNWSGAIPATIFKYEDIYIFKEGKMTKEEIIQTINKLK